MTTIRGLLQKRADAIVRRPVHNRLLRWTTPATRTPVRGAITDVALTTAALVAETARLRPQVLVLHRPVTRPALTPRDRRWLVRLARLTRGWRSALFIVQPDTLVRGHRHG